MFPNKEEGGHKEPPILLSNCSEIFEEYYPYYMVMGMGYEEYWNGDNDLTKYYRKAYEIKQDKLNYEFWLQGKYYYDAMLMVAPSYNSLSPQDPIPYHEEPFPITLKQVEERKIKEEIKNFERNFAMMQKYQSEVNTYFNQQNLEEGREIDE